MQDTTQQLPISKRVTDNSLQSVAIIGSGRMGRGIALWMLLHGRTVTLIENNPSVAEHSQQEITAFFERRIACSALSVADAQKIQSSLTHQGDFSGLEHCDLVIECVPEDMGMKRHVFAEITAVVGETTIIASNASSLEISRMAEFVDSPGRFMGMHFFYPVVANPIVELVRGNKSDPGLLRKLKAFFTEHGKVPVTTKDSPGFVVNRFFCPYLNTAHWLMEDMQLNAATIDEVAITLFGSQQGPIEVSNWLGNHNVYRDQVNLSKLGHFYTPTKGLHLHGETRKPIFMGDAESISETQQQTIRDRLLGCVFFTVLQILDEGISTAEDIDLAARLGLRFSIQPCALMDSLGAAQVRALIQPIIELHGDGTPTAIEDIGQLRPELQKSDD